MRLTEKNNSPYSTDIYDVKINEYDCKNYSTNTSIGACLDKLGQLEDLLENADSIKIIKRNGVASLHIDMILDNETYSIAEQLFGKEKVVDYDK
jgi:hypothetical protein